MERALSIPEWRNYMMRALLPFDMQDMTPEVINVSSNLFDDIVRDSKIEMLSKDRVKFSGYELRRNRSFGRSQMIEIVSKKFLGKKWSTRVLIKDGGGYQYVIPSDAKFFTFGGVMYTNLWEWQ